MEGSFLPHTLQHGIDFRLYPMVKLVVMFILGISMAYVFSGVFVVSFWLFLLISCLGIGILFYKKEITQSVLALVLTCSLGGLLSSVEHIKINEVLPSREALYEGVLSSEPQRHGRVLMADLLITSFSKPKKVKVSFLADSNHPNAAYLHIGNGIQFYAPIDPPTNFFNSTFDYVSWLKLHNYSGEVFLVDSRWHSKAVSIDRLSLLNKTLLKARILRQLCIKRLSSNLSSDNLAVISAMALGDKSLLTQQIKDDYAVAGASHVLALSGLHLSILYFILLFFINQCSRFLPVLRRKTISNGFLLLTVWAYVFLVGLSPSILRSAILLSTYSVLSLIDRYPNPINTLALVAFILLVTNPLALFDISFQLSFMAVLFILLLYKPFYGVFNRGLFARYRLLNMLAQLFSVSLAAQVGVAPLIAFYFNRLSTYFLFSNLVCIPCAYILIYGALALILFSWIQPLYNIVEAVVSGVSDFLNSSLHTIASLPFSSISISHFSLLQVIIVYFSLFLIVIFVRVYAPKLNFQ